MMKTAARLNKQRDLERHTRNHHMIVHGAIMEGVFPFTASMDGEAIKALLIVLSRLPGAEGRAEKAHKPGIVHKEIILPAHAPPEFADCSTLWNSVEAIEKSSDAQLAREIEVALPVELSPAAQLALVRVFVKDDFVDARMCAEFAIHDKDDGNPHACILLTIRPLKSDGRLGPKCRKVYDLDSQGNRIPDGKGGWKNH